jgi:hypothetical protein
VCNLLPPKGRTRALRRRSPAAGSIGKSIAKEEANVDFVAAVSRAEGEMANSRAVGW